MLGPSLQCCPQVLLFCHSVKMLNVIEQLILRAGYHFARLDGATRQQDRQALCDEFNASASLFLFLISTTAGGLGLNLTAANKSVHPVLRALHMGFTAAPFNHATILVQQ